MSDRGKFIVFEGIDGSGKSTQINLLAENLKKRGIETHKTLEPTYGMVGGVLHDILSGKVSADPKVTASLFVADRLDHLLNAEDGVCKCIDDGKTVICDRYYFSSYAYQSVEVPRDWVIAANRLAAQTLRPDCTIFIDITAEVAMDRISKNRQNVEIYESLDRLGKVREGYLSAFELMKDEEKIFVIDGNRDPQKIAEEIENIVINEVFLGKV
ncbi:MAG: dTMP kinase [Clostridia bacterium]|nr:dTMP kinase [Clostridia bacterium]